MVFHKIKELIGKQLEKLEVNHKEVTLYAGKVLATKREMEIRLERRGFGERRETWKRKELAMEGLSEREIDKAIERWKAGGKAEDVKKVGKRKRKSGEEDQMGK